MSHTPTPLPKTLGAFMWRMLRPYPFRVAFVLLSPILLAVENNALPYALKLVVDAVMAHEGPRDTIWPNVTAAIALYVGVLAFMMLVFRLREWVMMHLQPRIMANIRDTLFAHTTGHSHQFFSDHFAGSVAAKINDLARAINAMKDFICWRLVTSVSINLIAVALIASVHWAFAALVLGWIMLHLGLTFVLGKRVNSAATQNAEDRARLSGQIVDAIGNMATVRAFARRRHEREALKTVQGREIKSQREMLRRILWSRLVTDIPMCIMYLALFVGLIYGWQMDMVSAGDMVYVLFATFLVLEQTWMLGTDFPAFVSELGSAKNALSLIATPVEVQDKPEAHPLQISRGDVVFEEVRFGYLAGQPPLFDGLDLRIEAGEKLGLVGFSGSGKTTAVNLLLRLHDVAAGRITIDGQNIADVTQDSLREAIGMIPQDTTLFHRSLRDNIAYGRPDASDEDVMQAAAQAGCAGFIAQLPEGLHTLVGERGVKLSGGQRQRIALARAMLKNAPILVLDEATSALDSVTEAVIGNALETLMQGKTVLVIAHRLSTLSKMDRIVVFDKGRVVEEGTHASLLEKGGHYATMWHMQAGGFLPEKLPVAEEEDSVVVDKTSS